jgi:DNA invertase Pin-like site-specific DNA recombinase
MNARNIPFTPKNPDSLLWVLVIGRVSTPQQDVANIEAGYSYAERFFRGLYDGPLHVKHLGEQGSGMRTDRATIKEAIEEIETGMWDVVLMEDLSKPYRNPRWIYAFVQDCVDAGCRVLAPGDNLDTAEDNWEVTLGAAALRHGLHIPDTRRRVRRTATYSFHGGGMVGKVRFGYRKLTKEEAASGQFGPRGLRMAKLPECTPIIQEMVRRRLSGQSRNAVADWLNRDGVPTGPYASDTWTGNLVDDLLRDPILSGTRKFRSTIFEPIFETGRHRRKKNPSPETEDYPTLAHLTPAEQQELIEYLDGESHATGEPSPLRNRPRNSSVWPGQHAVCAICGGRMYRSGTFLKCSNALPKGPRTCWNHTQVEFDVTRAKVLPWVLGVLDQHPDFRDRLIDTAWQELERAPQRRQRETNAAEEYLADLKKRELKLTEAIARGGELDALVAKLAATQRERVEAQKKTEEIKARVEADAEFASREEVAARLDEAVQRLAETSFDFADLLRRLVPVFVIRPVQALDRPQIHPRARLTLSQGALSKGDEPPPVVSVELDLFEPPEHIKHLPACVAARKARPKATLQELADGLKVGKMTVHRALTYARQMAEQGMTDPYREVRDRPTQASRWGKRSSRPNAKGNSDNGHPKEARDPGSDTPC